MTTSTKYRPKASLKNIGYLAILWAILIAASIHYNANKPERLSNATLTYDVAGYYMYLPAAFIYDDLKSFSFKDTLQSPEVSVGIHQGKYAEKTGNFVFKYSSGMALQYLPAFTVAHIWASNSEKYKANGFSYPYHVSIHYGSLIYALIGITFLFFILLQFFRPSMVFLSILSTLIGTNYLVYTSFHAAESHNYLFTLNSILLFTTIRFYKNPRVIYAAIIGGLLGLAIITRPTEIVTCIIPLLWGCDLSSKVKITERLQFLQKHLWKYLTALSALILVGSIQLAYWKYTSGQFLFYSYHESQTFDFLSPHIYKCLFSAKAGWITYSPMILFFLSGIFFAFRSKWENRHLFSIYLTVFAYITFSWSVWWYGGSLGQRAMIQTYPFIIFFLAYFLQWVGAQRKLIKGLTGFIWIVFVYLNMWYFVYTIKGSIYFRPPQVTSKYFFKQVGRWSMDESNLKFLDSNEEYTGSRDNAQAIYKHTPDVSKVSFSQKTNTHRLFKDSINPGIRWVNVDVLLSMNKISWKWWQYNQLVVQTKDKNDKTLSTNFVRVDRFLKKHLNEKRRIDFDTEIPEGTTAILVFLLNAGGHKELHVHEVEIEGYR